VGRPNKKGRNSGPSFTQLFHYMQDCLAWTTLTPADRAVILELARRYDGSNNGRIGLSARDAADRCWINKDTATRCFRTLEERGFITCTQESRFGFALAAEYRLNWQRCDRSGQIPTRAFLAWKPPAALALKLAERDRKAAERKKAQSEKRANAVRNEGTASAPNPPAVRNEGTEMRAVS